MFCIEKDRNGTKGREERAVDKQKETERAVIKVVTDKGKR